MHDKLKSLLSVVILHNKQVYGNIMFKCLSNICHLVNSHTCTLSKKGLCSAFKTTLQWGLGFTYCFMHSQLLWSYSKEPWIHFCFRAFGSETGIYHLIIPVCVGIYSNQHLLHKWLTLQYCDSIAVLVTFVIDATLIRVSLEKPHCIS